MPHPVHQNDPQDLPALGTQSLDTQRHVPSFPGIATSAAVASKHGLTCKTPMGLQFCTQLRTAAVSASFLSPCVSSFWFLCSPWGPHDRSVSISAVTDPPSPRKRQCSFVSAAGPHRLPSFKPQGPPLADVLGFCLFPTSCILDK